MKIIFGLPIYAILLFAIWFDGCSPGSTNGLSSNLQESNSPTPTPKGSPKEDVYLVEGCEIPLPPKKRQTHRGSEDRDSETGNPVRVTSTTYEPTTDFLFTRGAFFVPQEERQVPAQLNKLVWIEELRVKDKIFAYIIFSQGATRDEGTGQIVFDAHKNIYRCYDSDGDGDFEYLINMSDTPPKVPKWASE